MIDRCPALLGIGEGIDVMKRIFLQVDELRIGKRGICRQ
jgi:hypothetical protein